MRTASGRVTAWHVEEDWTLEEASGAHLGSSLLAWDGLVYMLFPDIEQ